MITMPTTDVTDRANKPGDGPLRSGGQEGGASTADSELPSTRSPASEEQQPGVVLCRDLWRGTDTVRAAAQAYLPRAPGEDMVDYRSRLARSVFHNFFRRTVEGLTGIVFARDPVLSEDVPAQIVTHWENIDYEGTHGDVFCRDTLADGLTAGHAAILVDYPKTGGNLRRDQEQAMGVRPYWLGVRKEDIVSWRTESINGGRVLSQIVLRERQWVPKGAFGEQLQERYRVFYRSPEGVVGFWLLEINDQRQVVMVDEGTYPTQVEIPIAEVATSGSRGLFESDPPLWDLAFLNVAHYQQWSDYATSIHMTCVPLFVTIGMRQDGGGVVLGPNSGLNIEDPQGDAKYVSHDGASLTSCKAALDDLKSDMATLGLAMLAPQKRVAETAEAKRLDKSTTDSSLAVAARALQDAVEKALGFHARYLSLPDGGSVEINREFERLLLDAPIMQAFAQLVEAGFPRRPVLEALQRGGRIPADADLDMLELEWLMGSELDKQLPEMT